MLCLHFTFILVFWGWGYFSSQFLELPGTTALSTEANCTYTSSQQATEPAWNFPFCWKVCICQNQPISEQHTCQLPQEEFYSAHLEFPLKTVCLVFSLFVKAHTWGGMRDPELSSCSKKDTTGGVKQNSSERRD